MNPLSPAASTEYSGESPRPPSLLSPPLSDAHHASSTPEEKTAENKSGSEIIEEAFGGRAKALAPAGTASVGRSLPLPEGAEAFGHALAARSDSFRVSARLGHGKQQDDPWVVLLGREI